jgi:hypothetical protein
MKELDPHHDSLESLNRNISADSDKKISSTQNMSSEQFIATYQNGLNEVLEKIESAHPLHPITSEPGNFVRYSRQYPVYQTPSGDEFIIYRGVARPLK